MSSWSEALNPDRDVSSASFNHRLCIKKEVMGRRFDKPRGWHQGTSGGRALLGRHWAHHTRREATDPGSKPSRARASWLLERGSALQTRTSATAFGPATHVQAPGLGRAPTCRRPVISPELGGEPYKTWACDPACRVPPPCPVPLEPEAQRPGSVPAVRTCGSRGLLGQPSPLTTRTAPSRPPLSCRLFCGEVKGGREEKREVQLRSRFLEEARARLVPFGATRAGGVG
ncbi:uncharacterized protein LOC111827285 [Myotis lucifugus]|uniref:uncharacterized protein LOC111827285 n=1 Tax=Myotis lucifugus TaxID=59463 RepID=UPI000CCC4085|nr:uncharacterized protein LOC111827285 [Myotis lucifugus]